MRTYKKVLKVTITHLGCAVTVRLKLKKKLKKLRKLMKVGGAFRSRLSAGPFELPTLSRLVHY